MIWRLSIVGAWRISWPQYWRCKRKGHRIKIPGQPDQKVAGLFYIDKKKEGGISCRSQPMSYAE